MSRLLSRFVFIASITLLTMLYNGSAQAKLVDNLYAAEVEVASQSNSHRQQAIREVFERVILKVTGQPESIEHEAVERALRSVSNYLIQYGYSDNQGQRTLTATFDGTKVRSLLAEHQLPYWGSRRPELLMWIVTENEDGRRTILDSSGQSVFQQQLSFFARQLSLPIRMPLMDLTDSFTISPTDVWARFMQPIKETSKRYGSDGLFVGKIMRNAESEEPWVLDWSVEVGDRRLYGKVSATSKDWLAEPLMQQLMAKLSSIYSVTASDESVSQTMAIKVEGLNKLQHVLALESFLKSIVSVQDVTLKHYSQSLSEFDIVINGSLDHVIQSINLDGRLKVRDMGPFVSMSENQVQTYEWRGGN
ncbi:DUF2066 domain-containing protein [Idiomarina sp.]|uniref:DUF2066 domain-containing protein n=1 Tax=Idiomarina sp. TaxID=1874361 RepID=UPI001DBBE8BA|nr:DUF2066 domain-containing protein [Idiomarina sp.]MCJ8315961.1 DUF2066 domain-containing protein [Idiomarina sp.]NQZ15874.1 DUF2066 domain-containing protein [Idiomarina sp.]